MKEDVVKVLLIDDDEEDFLLTRDYLSEVNVRKYHLDWSPTYEQGLEEVRKRNHDVYLVDYRLGIESGLDLISQTIMEGYRAPMILLTGQGDQQIDERAMQIGAADYLIKGTFDPPLLDRSIRYSLLQFKVLEEVRNLHEQSELRVKERTAELAKVVNDLEKANKALMNHISERRLAEEALRESQNLLMAIARNFPNGYIMVLDKKLNYIFAEGHGLQFLGIKGDDIKGQNLSNHFSKENLEVMESPLKDAFRGKASTFEMQAFNRWFLFQIVPLADILGEISQIMMVNQDITERKIAEEEMHNALLKEKQLNELKSRFVSMASHEFRTPLATILSSVALIGRYPKTEDTDKRLKHINRIRNAVNNMTDTLNDFLSLDKLETGAVSYSPVFFALRDFAEDLKEEMQIFARQEIIMNYHYKDDSMLMLDKQLLRNVMVNLLSNAIKYSPDDSVITVDMQLTHTHLVVEITDQGIGIPEEDQKHIFNTFFRANNAINIQGTGLGLNIVKKYVDLMGGKIGFRSKLNQGTTFKVSLPININSK